MISTSKPERASQILGWLANPSRGATTLRLLLSLALFAGVWELIARYVVTNRLLLVPFSEVIVTFVDELRSGEFWRHSWTTSFELLIAFPIAVMGGVVIGAVLAGSKAVRLTLDPILTALYSLPIVALAPLFTSALGFGIASKVAIVILIAIFPVITSTDAGLRSADPALIETARSFTATPLQVLGTVTLPHSLPFIISGVRTAFSRALVGVIVAEFIGSVAGFGFVIAASAQTYQTARLIAYVMVLGVVGLLASISLTALETRLAPWRKD